MIRIGIMGYGNLGRGTELAIRQNSDMELVGIFTRREPSSVKTCFSDHLVYHTDKALEMRDKIDVMIICGGSAKDLVVQSPEYAKYFNIVDSFDTHARIPEHFTNVDKSAKESEKVAIISSGWDPGLFSLNRLYASAVLPVGKDYTFWGKGVSQGHSDAIRKIEGVEMAIQYTIPVDSALESVRNAENKDFTTREKHTRECFVVLKDGYEQQVVKDTIVNMPNYFADYDTTVHFISKDEFVANHKKMNHGGFVMRSGKTGIDEQNSQFYEFALKLDSNPEFTSSVLVACARAAYRLYADKNYGCKSLLEIPPHYLHQKSIEELRASLL